MSWRLLLIATLLLTSPLPSWSACEFKNLEPVNAIVNSTVQVECRSNCTPLALLHMKRPGDISSERSIGTLKINRNDPYPYIITDTIHLDVSYNDTWLVCKIITGSSNRSVRITLQGELEAVSGLKVVANSTHIHFTWLGPAVLSGIEVRYNVHFYREGKLLYNQTVTETFFIIPVICPCRSASFDVTPVAGDLVGESQCTARDCFEDPAGDPKIIIDKENFKNHSSRHAVKIAFKIQMYDIWCIPATATMTATCQYTGVNKLHTFHNLTIGFNQSFIDLLTPFAIKAHDFCLISLTLVYSSGYNVTKQATNISLFDTQSITWELNSNSRLLCVTCIFAPWIKIQSKCFIRMRIQNAANSSSQIVHLNVVGMPNASFRNLPTDGLYIVKLLVSDDRQRNFVAVFNQTFINFTTTSPPSNGENQNGNTDTHWSALVLVPVLIAAGIIVGAAIWYCKKGVSKWSMSLVGVGTPESDVSVILKKVQQCNPQDASTDTLNVTLQEVSEESLDVIPQDVPGGTAQVDSIDILDVDSKNNKGDDVIPQNVAEDDSVDVKTQVPGGTTQVDSIDILDMDSKNKKSDDVKPQDVSGGTVQVDSIHVDNLDVDSKNNEGDDDFTYKQPEEAKHESSDIVGDSLGIVASQISISSEILYTQMSNQSSAAYSTAESEYMTLDEDIVLQSQYSQVDGTAKSSGDVSNPTKESETDGSQPHSRLFVPSKSSDSSIRLRLIGTSQSKEEPRYGAGVFTYTSDHEEQRNNETTDNCKSI